MTTFSSKVDRSVKVEGLSESHSVAIKNNKETIEAYNEIGQGFEIQIHSDKIVVKVKDRSKRELILFRKDNKLLMKQISGPERNGIRNDAVYQLGHKRYSIVIDDFCYITIRFKL